MATRQGQTDPRVVRSRERVLEAALAELADRGFGGFSIDGVAKRAGVARSTIYRLGHDRVSLVAKAMETLNVQPRPDAGGLDPRADVVAIVAHLASAMQSSLMSDCLPAVLDGAERDPGLRELHHSYSTQRRTRLVDALIRLRESGQAVGDPERAAEALAGAVFYRRLMTPSPLRTDEVEGLVATVLGSD
ncbi:MAG: TetR/AcrR family transcriptional regulator [Nocardioides sp.]|uniref:TetR/AcrR family transcriptional regulator n=1 Tax=Nocardioides sp. TaxID=35761 RepID=UPI003D6A8B00